MDELNTEYLGLNSSAMPHHRARIKIGIISLLGLGLVMFALPGTAQERWFQIEVSVFSNESQADRSEETWYADKTQLAYPQPLRRLDSLLQNLMLPEFLPSAVEPPDVLLQPGVQRDQVRHVLVAHCARTVYQVFAGRLRHGVV